ncbi:MAG: hypothetical protein AAF288_07640 [Planctomycetota bacterium]
MQDWNPGDPTFTTTNPAGAEPGAQDGKGIVGAVNYLAGQGVNSVYFLPMNIGGDGQDTSPFADPGIDLSGSSSNNNLRYDVSKLQQWNTVFEHAQDQGVALNVVLNEAETPNKLELDNGTLGVERKLFYREMAARFGHLPGLQWNLSEEYNRGRGTAGELSPDTVKEFAAYLSAVDGYDHPLTVHNGNYGQWPFGTDYPEQHSEVSTDSQVNEWAPFLGEADFDLVSFQDYEERNVGARVEELRKLSAAAGRPIPVMIDEPESIDALSVTNVRREMTYDIYFSGGGVEWFVRGQDQSLEDFRQFEDVYRQTAIARQFMEDHLPFWEMEPQDTLIYFEDVDYGGAEVLAKEGEIYAIYLPDASNDDGPNGISPLLDLRDYWGVPFSVRWFDPRVGEFDALERTILGGSLIPIGQGPFAGTPMSTEDWVVLVERIDGAPSAVPEPGALTAMGAAAGLGVRRRR